ncbi:MAG: nuclear transport factor 2 family protein [Bacteroidetes bacterium]|nr:nuclear transport factor 2 family protein [Bacteroidota bacterium]
MSPKAVVQRWLDAFNAHDADTLSELYAEFASYQPLPLPLCIGRNAIRNKYESAFENKELMCIPDNLFEDGEWAILEAYDFKGSRSCTVFHIIEGMIVFQRSYNHLAAP